MRTEGQTDTTKLIIAFHNFAEVRSKNGVYVGLLISP